MNPITNMAKVFVLSLFVLVCILELTDLSEAARSRNRQRKNRLANRQSKRQQKSEVTGEDAGSSNEECLDLTKKVLRLKYETGINGTNLDGVAMLPMRAQPTARGPTYATAPYASGAQRLSTCPYDFVENFDSTRWPRVIMEASCSCDYCNLEPVLPTVSRTCPQPTEKNYCRPIYREVAVLRRSSCVGDFARYVWDVVTVSVGCECVVLKSES